MSENTKTVDVAVIGAGTAGMAAYRAARRRGKSAVIIEGGPYGTTCARVGCMPSKLLIAAAEAAHHAQAAGPLGVNATVEVDRRAVMDRVRRERDRFVGFVVESVEGFPESDRLLGYAHFAGPHELEVAGPHGSTKVTFGAAVIATGSAPFVPTMFDRVRDRLILNDHVFDLAEVPESVAVFGAGVIGLELGQAFHRLGARVRIFGVRGTVGPVTDPEVRASAAKIFQDELAVDFDAKVSSVEPTPGSDRGVVVAWTDAAGNPMREEFTDVLVAAGRRPNLGRLALDRAGINVPMAIDPTTLQFGSTPIFVAGDVTDHLPLLHEAVDEGTIAGDNAARFPEVVAGRRRSPLAIAFTDPGMAVVGGGFGAIAGRDVAVGTIDFADQGRSRVMLQNRGVSHLYADRTTRRFLGAELVAPRAEHLAHLLAWAHQNEMTVEQMLAMPFYHPVVEEGLRTALRDLVAKLG